MAALIAVVAIVLSISWAPAAHASQLETLAAANLTTSGNNITCTQTKIGYQVVPVSLKAGAVKLNFTAGASYASVGIYAKADSSGNTTGTVASVYVSDPYGKGSEYGNVAKTGTYYLLFYTSSYNGATGSKAAITQYPYKNTRPAVLNGATLGTGCGDDSKIAYYKISVPKRGYITVNVTSATGSSAYSSVQLRNAKKKSLIGPNYPSVYSGHPATFGVKKGTYYIAVKSYASLYRLNVKFTSSTGAVHNSKSRAVTIKHGKKCSAVMAAGEKVAWYKFKVTSTKKYTVKMTGKLYDGIRMTFSGAGYLDHSEYLATGSSSESFRTTALKPGTYYIKVTRSNAGNGFYTITWS